VLTFCFVFFPSLCWATCVFSNEFKELADAMETDRIARGEQPSAAVAAVGDDGEDDDGQSPPSASPPAAASNAVANAAVVAMRPISEPTARPRPGQRTLLECGCGVGNAMFPLLRLHPSLFIYGVDVSKNAIQCVQNHPDYAAVGEEAADLTAAAAAASSAETHAAASSTAATVAAPVESASNVGGRCAAWVVDLVHEDLPSMLRENHLDFATLIFVLSAIHPTKMPLVLAKLHRALKKDEGVLFLRD
jgi:SAM-dependent methyltransferase